MNDIDLLMAKIDLTDAEVDQIVAWHRAIREKPQKERPVEEKLDLSKILGTVRKSSAPAGFVKRF